MNINIKTTNFSLTPAIADYLEKKLASINRFADLERDNVYIHAELGRTTHHHRQGDIFRAEVTIHIGGHQHRAVAKKDDLYAAIDEVKDELNREIKTEKGKRHSIIRRGAQKLKNLVRFGRPQI